MVQHSRRWMACCLVGARGFLVNPVQAEDAVVDGSLPVTIDRTTVGEVWEPSRARAPARWTPGALATRPD